MCVSTSCGGWSFRVDKRRQLRELNWQNEEKNTENPKTNQTVRLMNISLNFFGVRVNTCDRLTSCWVIALDYSVTGLSFALTGSGYGRVCVCARECRMSTRMYVWRVTLGSAHYMQDEIIPDNKINFTLSWMLVCWKLVVSFRLLRLFLLHIK